MQLLIMKQDIGSHKKGDIVEIRATGTPFGGKEPEAFVMVEVPDVPMADYEHLNQSWESSIQFSVVASDPVTDSYQLKAYSSLVNSSNLGAVTKAGIEAFITNWNGSVVSFGTNEVIFSINIFDALKSKGFWDVDISKAVFTEQKYDQATGTHTVQIDYSALGNNPTYVERFVVGKGATILSHKDKVLVCEITRATVRDEFQRDIAEKGKRLVARRRYYIDPAVVDSVVSGGGTMTATTTQVATYLKDKVAD